MRLYGALAVFVLLAGLATPAAAQRGVQPLDRILPGVRASHPGTFYDAEGPFRGADGRMHYRLKWMTPDGRIIWLDTDARTGRVLGEASGGRGRAGAPSDSRRYAPRNNWRQERGNERRQNWRNGYDGGRDRDDRYNDRRRHRYGY